MDRRVEPRAGRQALTSPRDPASLSSDEQLAIKLVDVFMRFARGDLTARIPRTYKQDHTDAIAFYIEVLADQIGEQKRRERAYEASVATLIEKFIAVASGQFEVRVERTGRGDAFDTLAYLLNNVATELGSLVEAHDQQRVLLETVLESMLDGVLLLDEGGQIRRTNAAMAKLLGRASAELVGHNISAILAETERPLAEQLASKHVAAFSSRDTQFLTKEHGTLTVAVNGSPHVDFDGKPIGFVLVARDDRALRQVNAQLHLSERLATMGTLAAGVAHEVNNPLAYVSANVEFVLEEMEAVASGETLSPERSAEMMKALRASREGALRVRNIVRDLHHFARSGKEGATRLDLNALLETALNLVRNEIRHHARLTKVFGKPPVVLANEGRLLQVFLNLTLNAAQSIPLGSANKGEIRVTTGETGNHAFVEIRDTGTGIAEKDLPHIFDLFYTTKDVGEGTGLGLSIALRLVEQAGGRIEVESELGVGSTFRVLLPAATLESKRPRAPTKKRTSTRRLRVLVVDDEAEVGESVRRVLGRVHEVDAVTGAAEAIARLEQGRYDLVLCDLLMPEMTGMELHERLVRTMPRIAEGIVFMTAGPFSPEAQRFLGRIPNRRIEKPFDADALHALTRSPARRSSG